MALIPQGGLSRNSVHSLASRHFPLFWSLMYPLWQMQTLSPINSSRTQISELGHGLSALHVPAIFGWLQPCRYGSPIVPPGHWQENVPGSLLQTAPEAQGFTRHSSMSTQPLAAPVKPELHRHFTSLFVSIHWEFGPHDNFSHGSVIKIFEKSIKFE